MPNASYNSGEPPRAPRALPEARQKERPQWWRWLFIELPSFRWASRNTEFAAIFIGILVAFCFVPHIVSFQHRDDPLRRAWKFLPGQPILEAMEYRLYDERFSQRGPQVPDSGDKISIIAIDQNSLNVYNQWPWPRSFYANLIRRLKKAGARVIALDIDISDRQHPGPNGELSSDDRDLIAACAESKNVIFPSFFEPETTKKPDGHLAITYQVVSPFTDEDYPDTPADFPETSIAYLPQDSDGGYRRYPLYGTLAGQNVGSFAVLACGLYQKFITDKKSDAYDAALPATLWPSLHDVPRFVPTRTASFGGPDDPLFYHMLIRYWGPPGTFEEQSFSDVLSKFSDARLRQLYSGRIVFVGATAVILKDTFATPQFTAATVGSDATGEFRELMPGVEIHASVAAMLLDGKYIEPPNLDVMYLTLFGLSIFSAVWTEIVREHISRISRILQERWHKRRRFRRFRIRIQDLVWFSLYATFALIPPLAYWEGCVFMFVERNTWVVAAYPILASCVSSAMVLVFLFTLESAERRKVIHQVGLYMDADIMEEILAHPEEDFPRPRRTIATVMFTDLEGFTSYSETHEAEEVVAALNAFMTRMKPIIARYGGTVDKYIGDAIMCYFGVPIPRFDHAERALTCAIEMQEECVRFRQETGVNFWMRIGVHTGDLIAGSVGSEGDMTNSPHMNYTVIGDTVNVASRLEGKNKDFGSWIMCSRATVEAAAGVAEVVAARTGIKGKSQEVEVFIVRGWHGEAPRDVRWGHQLTEGAATPGLGEKDAQRLPQAGRRTPPAEPVPIALALPVGDGDSDWRPPPNRPHARAIESQNAARTPEDEVIVGDGDMDWRPPPRHEKSPEHGEG